MDLTQTNLIGLRDDIAARRVSAVAVVRAYLDRIDRFNATLNAYREVYDKEALARAAQVDAGRVTGPLAGVPVAIKDNLCTSWGRTTCSSRMLESYESPFTATAVAKLLDAGAIVLGKTNLDEFAMGSSGENCAFGATHNPWDTGCVTGGSSGGSAAAVAASLCAAALGSDTGGSIRQPAAFCGVVGVKPTYGRVSRWGLVAFASSLDQVGVLARTAGDAALMLQVISGRDALDATSADAAVPDYLAELDQPIVPLRIGIARQYLSDANDPAVNAAAQQAVDVLRGLGATVVDVDLPHTEYGIPTYYIVATAEASSNLARYDGVHYGHRSGEADELIDLYCRSRAEGFGDEVKRRIMLGTYVLSSGYYDAYYLRALKVRRLIKGDFDRAFQQCDAIVCPATPAPAFPVGEKSDDPLAMYMADVYTVNCNLAGLPGISLPAGFTDGPGGKARRRLPIGVQLLGPVFAEDRLLRIAHMFQNATDFHTARPAL